MTAPKSPPPRSSGSSKPHASRGEKVRQGKVDMYGGTGRGLGDTPNSRGKKIAIWSFVFILFLFIFMDCIDRANKTKKSYHYEPTSELPLHRLI